MKSYYPDSQNFLCLKCNETCLNCFGPSGKECSSCHPGMEFLKYSYECIVCNETCKSCSGTSDKNCTTCYSPF